MISDHQQDSKKTDVQREAEVGESAGDLEEKFKISRNKKEQRNLDPGKKTKWKLEPKESVN